MKNTTIPGSTDSVDQAPSSSLITSAARWIAAFILGQTLFFKFSGAAESVALFESLGAEPWGRIGSGVFEAIAMIMLIAPLGNRVRAVGAALVMGLMGGAIASHLFILGVEVQEDGGLLFGMAILTFVCGARVAWEGRQWLAGPSRIG
ncbi:MAG: fucose permease [Planctomycetota bacterium]|jgi:fucose permease